MTCPPVLTSPLLASVPGIRHAFFTRHGGVSKGIYESLNLGRGSGDEPGAVGENRRRAAGVFGLRSICRWSLPGVIQRCTSASWTARLSALSLRRLAAMSRSARAGVTTGMR